jgi:hypothetical protein
MQQRKMSALIYNDPQREAIIAMRDGAFPQP